MMTPSLLFKDYGQANGRKETKGSRGSWTIFERKGIGWFPCPTNYWKRSTVRYIWGITAELVN